MTSWADGERYQRYMGRWSTLVAAELLEWLAPPDRLGWVDVGCGTGVLAGAVAARCSPAWVVGVDPSAGFLRSAREVAPPVRVARADAQRLPLADDVADRVVSGLVLNFVPDPALAVAEMVRVLRPTGEVALYVWDYAEGMQMIRQFWDVAAAIDPQGVAGRDQGELFGVCHPDALRALLEEAGLVGVRTRALEVPTVFTDLDDLWTPFLGGTGPAPGYVASLAPDRREALQSRARRAPACAGRRLDPPDRTGVGGAGERPRLSGRALRRRARRARPAATAARAARRRRCPSRPGTGATRGRSACTARRARGGGRRSPRRCPTWSASLSARAVCDVLPAWCSVGVVSLVLLVSPEVVTVAVRPGHR